MLEASNRRRIEDEIFVSDEVSATYRNCLFLRVVAKEREFRSVDFRYTIFDLCYLRKCRFLNCDFTGCRFVAVNLAGSTFDGCRFDYATFERTQIDPHVLSTGCPGYENLKLKFARSLRMNYAGLGEYSEARIAHAVERTALLADFRKAAWSNEQYYRAKYKGASRVRVICQWLEYWTLEKLWGNGESPGKLLITGIFVCFVISFVKYLTDTSVGFLPTIAKSPLLLFEASPSESNVYATVLYICRLVLFTGLMTVLIRRYSRR